MAMQTHAVRRLALCAALLLLPLLLLCGAARADAPAQAHTTRKPDAAVWLDEGVEARATLNDWEDARAFCFYDNATLRIRLDPLNSTLQPYVVRTFGQSKEAHEIYDFLVRALSKLQEHAWPLRSFFWAWSDLRVVVSSPQHDELRFSYTRSSTGAFCRGMLLADQSAPQLSAWISDEHVAHLQLAIRFLSTKLCGDCVHGCLRSCTPLDKDTCLVELSPYHAPCVTIAAPTKPFLSTAPPAIPLRLEFQTVLSSLFMQNFFLGLFLIYAAERLARSRTFHYALGASVGVCLSAIVALYIFSRQARSLAKAVPGAQLFQSIGSLVSFAVPITSFVLLPSLYRVVSWGLSSLAWFWACDEVFGVPHLGKIYFFAFGAIGLVLVWWNQWGASPAPAEQQSQDEIDEIGHLDDDLPLTSAQTTLARALKLLGAALLFYSTSSTEISLLLLLLVSLTRVFQFFATTFYFWYHYEPPGRHSVLVSKKEFEKQAQTETEKAMAQLRAFLQENPDELDRVSEENEIRLRRFMRGRDHMDVATRDSVLSARKRASTSAWSYCSVQ